MAAGDFVRNVKQLVDLLRQIATVGPPGRRAHVAAGAAEALVRGVVAASSGPSGTGALKAPGIRGGGPVVP